MAAGKKAETNFWKLLRAVGAGPNTMGDITQQGTKLTNQLDQWTNPKGQVMVEATPMGGGGPGSGFQLSVVTTGGPNTEIVYWLPWKDFEATSVKRAVAEKCNIVMTTGLTGCTFSVTPTMLVHTAHGAYLDKGDNPSGAQGRINAEEVRTGPRAPTTARLQVSNPTHAGDFQYAVGSRHLVFGMKLHTGAWTYKVFRANPHPGSWFVLV
jgi:hypothetical protein